MDRPNFNEHPEEKSAWLHWQAKESEAIPSGGYFPISQCLPQEQSWDCTNGTQKGCGASLKPGSYGGDGGTPPPTLGQSEILEHVSAMSLSKGCQDGGHLPALARDPGNKEEMGCEEALAICQPENKPERCHLVSTTMALICISTNKSK